MVEPGRLRFRRHLAACVLVVLLSELRADLLKAGMSDIFASKATPDSPHEAVRLLRATRVRLAAAHEMGVAPLGSARGVYGEHGAHDDDDASFIARAVARLRDAMPVLDLNYSLSAQHGRRFLFDRLDSDIDDYYSARFPANTTLDDLQLMSVRAALRAAPIPLHTSWGYETRELLRQGSLPVRNDDLCAAQLAHLAHRLERALKSGAALADQRGELLRDQLAASSAGPADNFESRQIYMATDLEIMRYLDTFGRAPSDTLLGNVRWYGSRVSCLRTRLRPVQQHTGGDEGDQRENRPTGAIKFRYCMGAYRSTGWLGPPMQISSQTSQPGAVAINKSAWVDHGVGTSDVNLGNYFLRVGLCLPEACDSAALERPDNLRALERLLKFNLAKPFSSDHYKLADLYCLPDARSPLRSIPLAGKLLLLAAAGWLALVLLATTVHLNVDKFYTRTVERLLERRTQSAASKEEGEPSGELRERDILGLELAWIKLNVRVRDRARQLIEGVDLIDCLSLHSNWLKYTRRVKLACVRLHAEEQELERRNCENRRLAAASGLVAGKGPLAAFGRDARLSNSSPSERIETPLEADTHAARLTRALGERTELDQAGQVDALATAGRNHIDTSSLNALKVIALVWIFAGHCIFFLGSAVSNTAILRDVLSTLPAFALSNGAIYITELFFVITGALSAYLVFKHTTRQEANYGGARDQIELSGRSSSASSSSGELCGSEGPTSKTRAREQLCPNGGGGDSLTCIMEQRLFGAPFWLLMTLNRYLRIAPTYLLVYAFVKLVSVYVGGEGQLWDYAVSANSMRRACQQESWLPVLTLSTNYVDIYRHCIVGGWYLSADMQFAIMAVPLLVVLALSQRRSLAARRPPRSSSKEDAATRMNRDGRPEKQRTRPGAKSHFVASASKRLFAAYALVSALALLSALISILSAVLESPVDMTYLIKFSPHTMAVLSQNIAMYTNSVFRFRAFALGLILGHLLYLYEFRLIGLPRLVQLHGTKLSVIAFWLGFCIMFAPVLYPMGKLVMSHDVIAAFTVLSAAAIDLVLCALIFLICVGKAPKIVLFVLNSPLWSLFSSLSLSAFLVHTEVIIVLTSILDPPPSVSFGLLLFVLSATLLLTYGIALGLYLAFEMPLSRLIESIMRSFIAVSGQMKNVKKK